MKEKLQMIWERKDKSVFAVPKAKRCYFQFSISKRTTSAPPMIVPIEPPKFAKVTINRIRVTLLFQKPLRLNTSSERFSKSLTLGRRRYFRRGFRKNEVPRYA